jgi:hypothetical protein
MPAHRQLYPYETEVSMARQHRLKARLSDEERKQLEQLAGRETDGNESRLVRSLIKRRYDQLERETQEQRELREQFEIRYQHLANKRKTLGDLSREQASEIEDERIQEERNRELRAKELLLRKSVYEVSCETTLPQSRLIELKAQALAEQSRRTEAELRGRAEIVDRAGGAGRDKLERRIALLREDAEESPASTFPELNASAWRDVTY